MISKLLHTPLDPQSSDAADFLKGGYKQPGYGVPAGASIDGSFSLDQEGTQGYYVTGGKETFLRGVETYKTFFEKHRKNGNPIRLLIKTGIGGQHTPFQGIADAFSLLDSKTGLVVGEYELGKDYDASISAALKKLGATWNQLAVIPSSKSGSTDETMMIFVQIMEAMFRHALEGQPHPELIVTTLMRTLHDINFIDGQERPGADLFKVDAARFGTTNLIDLLAKRLTLDRARVKALFANVLGRMVFETTPRASQSRLAAFIENSGLKQELGSDAPGVVDMFDNVGGRWTGDLHMMAILGFYNLDAAAYWQRRRDGIEAIRRGKQLGNTLAQDVLDQAIRDIALVLPDVLFWFGKSVEQNFNESIWQEGFTNLIAVRESQWNAQKAHYQGPGKKVIVLKSLGIENLETNDKSQLASVFADLFTTFYGMTHVVGTQLIERSVMRAGLGVESVALSSLSNPGTKIVQENLFLRQPYVELGKGLLETEFKALQKIEQREVGALEATWTELQVKASRGELKTNLEGYSGPSAWHTAQDGVMALQSVVNLAAKQKRKVVPFLYLEGEAFTKLRDRLIDLGVEWVMQGTGDQHISYQQVLAQPSRYLPLIISFVSPKPQPGLPAIGFAKGYLDHVSPDWVRDTFAEKSYLALTDLKEGRGNAGGRGMFLRLSDTAENRKNLQTAFEKAWVPAK